MQGVRQALRGAPKRESRVSVGLASSVLHAVFRHAMEAYPYECCGFLTGPRGGPLDAIRMCVNVAAFRGASSPGIAPSFLGNRQGSGEFALSLEDMVALEESLKGSRPAQVLYHSHPDAPAIPSAADIFWATLGTAQPMWPLLHLIVEVRRGKAVQAVLYSWRVTTTACAVPTEIERLSVLDCLSPEISRGAAVQDSIVQGSTVQDSVVRDSVVRDSVVRDSVVRDSVVRDSVVRGSVVRATPAVGPDEVGPPHECPTQQDRHSRHECPTQYECSSPLNPDSR